jgi:hypothetical protein
MVWWGGHIIESNNKKNSLASGLHRWINIDSLSKTVEKELTHTWWIVRRLVAWAAKVDDDSLPPIICNENKKNIKKIVNENILWDGTIINQIKNI